MDDAALFEQLYKPRDENEWVSMAEKPARLARFIKAKASANRFLRRSGGQRSWVISKEQANRFCSCGDPVSVYFDEVEYFLAREYSSHGHFEYRQHFSRYPAFKDRRSWFARMFEPA